MEGLKVILRGEVRLGKDGNHHSEDCCKLPKPWTREEKGFGTEVTLETPWWLPCLPPVGSSLWLWHPGSQDVTVNEIAFDLHGEVVIYVGGWVHWETTSVVKLFEESSRWFYADAIARSRMMSAHARAIRGA